MNPVETLTLAVEDRDWPLDSGETLNTPVLVVYHNGEEACCIPYEASDEEFAGLQKEWEENIVEDGIESLLEEAKRRFAIWSIFLNIELAASEAASLMDE